MNVKKLINEKPMNEAGQIIRTSGELIANHETRTARYTIVKIRGNYIGTKMMSGETVAITNFGKVKPKSYEAFQLI